MHVGLVLDWQKKLGYRNDPFITDIPHPVKQYLVGTSSLQERINLFLIKEEQFGTIAGEKGTGKTMLLTWMDEELAPQKSHAQHYVDAAHVHTKDAIIKDLLDSRKSFLQKGIFAKAFKAKGSPESTLLSRLAKENKNVILIDNAGHLNKGELEFLAEIVAKTPTHLIFADTAERIKRLDIPPQLVDKLKITMPEYTHEQLTELLRKRIEGAGGSNTYPFTEKEIDSLIKKSGNNPVRMLTLARERAIELSLKATAPPPQPHAATAPANVEEKKAGIFTIRIERTPTAGNPAMPQGPVEIPAFETKEPVTAKEETAHQERHEDAQLLMQVIENAEKNAQQPEKHETPKASTAKNDKMIEQLAQEFAKQQPAKKKPTHKTPSKPAKKAAKKR